jgi:trigger factor
MNVTATPAANSTILLEIELPPENLARSMDEATRRLARRTKVAGFRPGKAPRFMLERLLGQSAVLDEAVELSIQKAYREALVEQGIVPLTEASVEVVQAVEGQPLIFKATVQVPPEVTLGDYRNFNFAPEIDPVDEAKVDQVITELRDQNSTLRPLEDRPAANGDYAVVGFVGTRDGQPFEGGSSDRMPIILGEERLIPGFEAHIVGSRVGDHLEFDIDFPADYGEASLAGQQAHFAVEVKELREKVMPPVDDEFAGQMGEFADVAELRLGIQERLERNALDRARHTFSDRIIQYAVANATLDVPPILVDQEVEVMHDEFRATIARQGIGEAAYLKATEQTEADLHTEFRPRAEDRVKTLLVLSKIADAEGITIDPAAVEAEVGAARRRYAGDSKTIAYFESERGRSFIRSTLRRTRTAESLVDAWLAAHPDHPALPHLEDDAGPAIDSESAGANAAIGATDPGTTLNLAEPAAPAAELAEPADNSAQSPAEPAANPV